LAGPTVSCPTCGDRSIQTVNVKRSTVPKELAAEYFAATGTPSSDVVPQSVCARCGCRWLPRTSQERQLKALSGQLGQEAMRTAQAQGAVAASPAEAARKKVSMRTLILAVITVLMILLALFT
jgi:hypothetical protein